jgi:hypothetical protein
MLLDDLTTPAPPTLGTGDLRVAMAPYLDLRLPDDAPLLPPP